MTCPGTTPSFTRISSASTRTAAGRAAEYLKRWVSQFDAERIPYYDYRDERIDVFGTTALLRSTNKSVRLIDGVETVGMTMYIDVYVQQDGAWKCVQAQLTPVAPANSPPDETIVRKYIKGQAQP